MKKHRAPIEQLRIAGEEARQQLIKRGIISSQNLEVETAKRHPGLILPGIPAYLPHKWTIKSSQRIMYDIFKMWQFKNKDSKKVDDLASFIEFCITEMNHQEETAKKKMKTQEKLLNKLKSVPVLAKIFEPMNTYETIKGIKKFFVDSFAVSVIVNGEVHTTGEFADFFFTWTDKLYTIWEKQDGKKLQTNKISSN